MKPQELLDRVRGEIDIDSLDPVWVAEQEAAAEETTRQRDTSATAALLDATAWALGATFAELNRGQPSQAHVLELLSRSASTPERKKLLAGICDFREEKVPARTTQEWLRYNSTGRWS